MPQYFENDPNLQHEYSEFNYGFGTKIFRFRTDAGVFSRDHVDSESALLMSQITNAKGNLLDLGCGYGCIGIILASTHGLTLTQADINERALELATHNRAVNGVEGESVLSDCFDALGGRKFDIITLNPPIHAGKEILHRMYEGARDHLCEGGAFYIVIMKKHGAESTVKKLRTIYGTVDVIYKKSGSFVVKCMK